MASLPETKIAPAPATEPRLCALDHPKPATRDIFVVLIDSWQCVSIRRSYDTTARFLGPYWTLHEAQHAALKAFPPNQNEKEKLQEKESDDSEEAEDEEIWWTEWSQPELDWDEED